MDGRRKFVEARRSGDWSMRELCERFGISRKTAYKWLSRYDSAGPDGLEDRSRARRSQAHRIPAAVERQLVELAEKHRKWGPRKLVSILRSRSPEIAWPAKSTAADILKRHGLTKPRGPRPRRAATPATPLAVAHEPNDVWATDFKGWYLSGNRERLEPLAVCDLRSRFCILCQLVRSTDTDTVWRHLERAFHEYGLPSWLRTDGGPPFGTHGLAGLSHLGVRLLRAGIRPERITPGKPQQNGCIERWHWTVEVEAMRPRARTFAEQARRLEAFRTRYNEVRPHEALDDRAPADVYRPSPRRYSGKLSEFEYESHVLRRRVQHNGIVTWAGHKRFLGEALSGEEVGFEQVGPTHWAIRFGPLELALFDEEHDLILRHDTLVWADEDDE